MKTEEIKISPRLLPGIQVGGAWVSVDPTDKADRYGKPCWRWYVDLADGQEFNGEDLYGWDAAGGMLQTLCGFLAAFAKAQGHEGSELSDLFPEALAEWASQNSDELEMLGMEEEELDHE